MKKLIYVLCLCLCLNGAMAFAEAPEAGVAGVEAAVSGVLEAAEAAEAETEQSDGTPTEEASEEETPEETSEKEKAEEPVEAAEEEAPKVSEAQPQESEAASEPEADAAEQTEPPKTEKSEASGDSDQGQDQTPSQPSEGSDGQADTVSDAPADNAGQTDSGNTVSDAPAEPTGQTENSGETSDDKSGQTNNSGETSDDKSGQTDNSGGTTDDKSGQTDNSGETTDDKSGQIENSGETTDDKAGQTNPGSENPDQSAAQTDSGTKTPEDGAAQPDEPPTTGDEADAPVEAAEPAGMPEGAEVWIIRNGAQIGGSLADIVGLLNGDETVYLRIEGPLHMADAPLYKLAGVRFRPDAEVFGEESVVRVYGEDPANSEDPAVMDFSGVAEGDRGDIYVRVEARETKPDDEGEEEPACQIAVDPASFPAGVWQTKQPTFKLSGIPAGTDWNYATLIFDERFIPLSGDTFTVEEEGVYTLRFVIQDKLGDILSVSPVIRGWFDWTAPSAVIATAADEDFAIDITGNDGTSGVQAISVDSGRTWVEVENGETYRYSAKKQRTLKAGMIRIRDVAGNVYKSTKAYTLAKAPSLGGIGGKSTKKKELPHSSTDPEDAAPYAVKLRIPEGTMRQLTIDGKPLDLTLMVDRTAVGGDRKPAGFAGTLTRWMSGMDDVDVEPDTLILEADVAWEGALNAEWRFNGEVYRELSECGVRYLGFKVGEDLCVVPTEGFTGGSKYTELKMLGVSTRKFDYTLTMKADTDPGHVTAMTEYDFSRDCDLALAVEVENMSYELSSSTKSLMYFYDVYLGPEEMMDYPFGAYGE